MIYNFLRQKLGQRLTLLLLIIP